MLIQGIISFELEASEGAAAAGGAGVLGMLGSTLMQTEGPDKFPTTHHHQITSSRKS